MYFVYLVRMALEYHTYLLFKQQQLLSNLICQNGRKKQFLSWKWQEKVFPRNFILKEHADSSKSGEAVKTVFFFFFLLCYDYPLLYFAYFFEVWDDSGYAVISLWCLH